MARHLIYIGQNEDTGLHRVALFDDANLLARSLPVKDTAELPDAEYLNCSVVEGRRLLNLNGSKVLRVARKDEQPIIVNRYSIFHEDIKVLWARGTRPGYCYGCKTYYSRDKSNHFAVDDKTVFRRDEYGKTKVVFETGNLLSAFSKFAVWDGSFSKKTLFVVGQVAVRETRKRFEPVFCYVLLHSDGGLSLTCDRELMRMYKSGCDIVQAGSNVLRVDEIRETMWRRPSMGVYLKLRDEDMGRLTWYRMSVRHIPKDKSKIEFLYGPDNKDYRRDSVSDLRHFSSAKVFGVSALQDCRSAVFPESLEEFWVGCVGEATSLREVYLPPGLKKIHEYITTPQRLKKINFYSDSEVVKEFAARNGAKCVSCSSGDEFMQKLYAATGDSIDLGSAVGIATLMGVESQSGDDVMTASLAACKQEGIASGLRKKLAVRRDNAQYINIHRQAWSENCEETRCKILSRHAKLLTELFIAGLTQFYPYTQLDGDAYDNPYDFTKLRFDFGDYRVTATRTINTVVQNNSEGVRKGASSVFVIEDVRTGDYIHSFCDYANRGVVLLDSFAKRLEFDGEPNAVLRYASKLSKLYSWGHTKEQNMIRDSVFLSFLPLLIGTVRSKREILGIDLHTGNYMTASYTMQGGIDSILKKGKPSSYLSYSYRSKWFSYLNSISDFTAVEGDIVGLLPAKCGYRMNKI